MPGFKDLAALPTSWALTTWDALPVILSVEAAIAVVILGTLHARSRSFGWLASGSNVAGGVAYLAIFGSNLGFALVLIGVCTVLYQLRALDATDLATEPRSPLGGLQRRAWSVLGAAAASAGIAAVIKILVGPFVAHDNPVWFALAVAGGMLPFGTLGTAAIPALAASSATDSLVVGSTLLVAASLRPHLRRVIGLRRNPPVRSLPG
jgi:hypothetical protein